MKFSWVMGFFYFGVQGTSSNNGSVRLLLTKNPVYSLGCLSARDAVSRLNGSRDHGRQLARYQARSFDQTAL